MNDLPGGPRHDDEVDLDRESVHGRRDVDDDQHSGEVRPDPPRPVAESLGTCEGPASEHARWGDTAHGSAVD